jgi:Concanavalin A-like lectin/glucanases superfamily
MGRAGILLLSLTAGGAPTACSSGEAAPNTSAGGSGTNAGSSGNPGASGSVGASGTTNSAGTGGASSAGSGGTGASGGAGSSSGGSAGATTGGNSTAGSGGSGGSATSCAGNAISLSANGTADGDDAAQARLVIDMLADLPIGNANRTIEFWADIKTTDWLGEKNELYLYGDPATNAAAFGLDFGTNTVTGMATNHATLNPVTAGGFNDDSRNDLGITSTARQWVHIAMTWNGTAVKTYVNGALKITSPGTGGTTMLATKSSPITTGCNPQNKGCFNGSFDELRVWKTARSDAEISANFDKNVATDDANLVGYWKFEDAPASPSASDSVTTAGHTPHPATLNAATPAGLPTFIPPNPPAPIHCR